LEFLRGSILRTSFQEQPIAMPDIACIVVAVCVALYFASRLTLRYCFPPDT
jgi:hypothetical protein